jgi:NTE family protein
MAKVAISFKGGSARGMGSIGMIKFLQENELKPDLVAGSSSGGMVAAAYAYGLNWKEIKEMFEKIRIYELLSPVHLVRRGYVISKVAFLNKLYEIIPELDKKQTQEDLGTELVLFATDLNSKKRVYLEKGQLASNLATSSAYPLLLPHTKTDDGYLIDGDLTSSFSVNYLRGKGADIVIGVGYDASEAAAPPEKEGPIASLINIYRILMGQVESLHDSSHPPDIEVRYDVDGHSYLNFSNLDKIVDNGYKAAQEHKDDILKAFA